MWIKNPVFCSQLKGLVFTFTYLQFEVSVAEREFFQVGPRLFLRFHTWLKISMAGTRTPLPTHPMRAGHYNQHCLLHYLWSYRWSDNTKPEGFLTEFRKQKKLDGRWPNEHEQLIDYTGSRLGFWMGLKNGGGGTAIIIRIISTLFSPISTLMAHNKYHIIVHQTSNRNVQFIIYTSSSPVG